MTMPLGRQVLVSQEELMTGNYWRDKKGGTYRISDMTDNHLTATIHLIESRKSNLGNVDDLIDTIHFNMNLEFLKRGLHDPKTVEERFEQTEVKDQDEVQRIVIQMRSRRR
jgi:hypothetical protein